MKQQLESVLVEGVGGDAEAGVVERALAAVRAHLGMEVAYLSEFVGGRSVLVASVNEV